MKWIFKYAESLLCQTAPLTSTRYHGCFCRPFFNEFVIHLSAPVHEVNDALLRRGILGGFPLEQIDPSYQQMMLVAVTELRSKTEIDQLAEELERIL